MDQKSIEIALCIWRISLKANNLMYFKDYIVNEWLDLRFDGRLHFTKGFY